MFAAGELVVYGGEGVCRVEGVGTPSLPGMDKTRLYYTLAPLYRSGQVMTPVDTRVLMRPLLTGQEVQELIGELDQLPEEQAESHNTRAIKDLYHQVVASYDCKPSKEDTSDESRSKSQRQTFGRYRSFPF